MRESEVKRLQGRKDRKQVSDNGLVARGNTDGSVSWVMVFKSKGIFNRHTFGSYPDTGIDEAQERAITYRRKWKDEGLLPKEYDELIADKVKQDKKIKQANAITLRVLLDKYIFSRKGLGRGDGDATLRDEKNTVLSVWEPFLDTPIQKIDSNELLEHFFYWTSQRRSPQTGKPATEQAKKAVRYIKAIFNYAIDVLEILERNPAKKITAQHKTGSKQKTHFLKTSECHKLYDWLTKVVTKAGQDKLIENGRGEEKFTRYNFTEQRQIQYDAIAIQLLTGLRQHEVLDLAWDYVYLEPEDYEGDTQGAYFWITTSKQKKEFGVPITEEMKVIFDRRKKNRTNEYVFPSLKKGFTDRPIGDDGNAFKVLNRLMPKLKEAPHLSANVLRHTFATACMHEFNNWAIVDQMTGHISGGRSSRFATPVYVHTMADTHRDKFQTINSIMCDTKNRLKVDWEAVAVPTETELNKELSDPNTRDFHGGAITVA